MTFLILNIYFVACNSFFRFKRCKFQFRNDKNS